MIPFDVDPMGYYLVGICAIFAVLSIIIFIFDNTNTKAFFEVFACLFAILSCICAVIFIIGGSTYTDTITICKHIQNSDMTVIDTNENVYYICDIVTKFKVADNETVKVKIKEELGYKWIYSIDAPISCGNQTCGVSP
ncbi:MAG: hypothetical protein WCX79_00430 [Candidatus Paceibacterota bacterium]|jgi:hypothetical protein